MMKQPRCVLSILVWGLFVGVGLTSLAQAAEPVINRSQELETVRDDFGLADGPAWDGQGSLYVPDVKGGSLYRYWPKQDKWLKLLPEAGRISASFYNNGKLYLSDNGNSRIAFLQGKEIKSLYQHDIKAKPAARPNDLVADRQGGVYYTLTGPGEVCYIPAGKKGAESTSKVVTKVNTPNGIILSPDEKTLYVSAYVPKEIWAYPVKFAGELGDGKLFSKMDDGPDKGADGMCTDRAGNVYCCGFADVWIWNPAGKLLDKLKTPTRPINCTFGDSDMQSLYITGFGGLYRQRMNISGRSPQPADSKTSSNKSKRPATAIPENITASLDVTYAQYGSRKVLADLFVPAEKSSQPRPAIVVVHGGGWLHGDKTKFRALAVQLATQGYVTMAIEYRLAGEAKFPAAIHDCNAAVRYLRAHADQYGIDPNQIGAVGGSAGGHLVGLMATASDVSELQGQGGWSDFSSKLQSAVVMAGPMEMATGSVAERSISSPASSNSNIWLGKTIKEAPELYRLADAHLSISKNDSSILFLVGEKDKPQRNQPSRDKLKELGITTEVVVYPGARHGCWNQLPWFNDVVADIDRFFQNELK
ncbi:MAG: SMP-30/gluconolactonase/LRE family protein [Planctomycetaceae bacterium]|nr:SMP-30/gluconolactonase/LRE family protein [Planctomycetaceae bacterium]